ncbi:hypothetical protein BDD43_1496 [Mucilaginibacter gracilis]|uniref:DUF6249 domain-containing protein n=1 Tax=Mucilaginibacter gracilis TaxID=423350 RepID=A0A495IY95_9SPHI|nr:DUF6249 domain-containing protein [Mucilaginibacter gracilis]RKR81351.1 hypothetical protein BDD43_1496 [Mucilaginibacter gracilis]
MDTANLGILAGIIISLSTFALIFSVFYLYKREKMAMIERGMDPRIYKQQSAPYQTLKWGLLLMGSGLGLFIAFVLDHKVFTDDGHVAPIYFSMIGLFGGLGLLASFLVEKKQTLDKE